MGNEIKTVLLKSVQLYDPDPKGICDLFLCGGRVAAVGRGLAPNLPGVAVLDGSGLTAFPGLVDQHVHFTGGGGVRLPQPCARAVPHGFYYRGCHHGGGTAGH